jgi:hypothetical protein
MGIENAMAFVPTSYKLTDFLLVAAMSSSEASEKKVIVLVSEIYF